MHNLSDVFIQREKDELIDGDKMYCFSLIFPKNKVIFLSNSESDILKWVEVLQEAIGYVNISEVYTIKGLLGNGKFGVVRLGIHKDAKHKVAIKIQSKKDMSQTEFELIRSEIEVLKICQHPNIIRIYDVFEDYENIYISESFSITNVVMEYCGGSDFHVYLSKRSFKLEERRAAEIIYEISTAIFYLHSFGIAHRDIKPENILMTDNTDTADIRILDFGLSKFIGPGQKSQESFGTLVRLQISYL